MTKRHFAFLLIVLLLISMFSCSVRKHYSSDSYFVSSDFKALNGKYFMDRDDLYEFLNIKAVDYGGRYTNKYSGVYTTTGKISGPVLMDEALSQDSTNFIILDFNGKDTLNITYRDDDFWYKTSYKGKLKKKYFQISLQNKRYPFFPVISRHDVDRIRIGMNQTEEVVIHNYSEHWGTFLLFGAHSGGDERAIKLEKYERNKNRKDSTRTKSYLIVK